MHQTNFGICPDFMLTAGNFPNTFPPTPRCIPPGEAAGTTTALERETDMARKTWKQFAQEIGWTEVERDPNPDGPQSPTLYHEDLDRVWPLGDWEGAARDLGYTSPTAA
jgi:hypothetical protein